MAAYWKYIPEHERAKIPEADFAGPGRSFPIRNQEDVENAAYLIGHAANPNAVKQRIIEIARRKGLALPEAWRQKSVDPYAMDMLVAFGGEVKAIGEGRIGGYLVRFSTAKDPDLEGDFFTKDTDFGINTRLPLYYHHGQDRGLKTRRIGEGEYKIDDVGLWYEAQISLRDAYERKVLEMVNAGKMGYSSGALGHLVERESAGKGAYHMKTWIIGEASTTPTPAEPRNRVVSLKSLLDIDTDEDAEDGGELALPSDAIMTERDFERFLREAGFSRSDAVAIVASGYKALRQREADLDDASIIPARVAYARALESQLLTGVL